MSLPRVERVSSKKVIDLRTLDSVPDKFLLPEIRNLTSQWALEENKAQARMRPPNMASRVVIDRRHVFDLRRQEAKQMASAKNVKFINMKSNIRFLYTDVEVLALAVRAAYTMLVGLTAKKSGFTISTYGFYLQDFENSSRNKETWSVEAALKWIRASTGDGIRVALQGPTAGDRRKRIYEPKGGTKQKSRWVSPAHAARSGKEISRYKFLRPKDSAVGRGEDGVQLRSNKGNQGGTVLKAVHRKTRSSYQVKVTQAIGQTVQKRIRTQFRGVGVYYRFVKHKGIPMIPRPADVGKKYGSAVPELAFRMKRAYK